MEDISKFDGKQKSNFINNYKTAIRNLNKTLRIPFKYKIMLFKLTNRRNLNSMISNVEKTLNNLKKIKNSNSTIGIEFQLTIIDKYLALLHSIKRTSNNYKKLKHLRTHFKEDGYFFPYYKEVFDVNFIYVEMLADTINKYNEMSTLAIKNPDKGFFYSLMDKNEAEKLTKLIANIEKSISKSRDLINFLIKQEQSMRKELDRVFNVSIAL